jgi:hypothetical protein
MRKERRAGGDDHVLRNWESSATDGGGGTKPGLAAAKTFLDMSYKAWILLVVERASGVMTEAGEEADGFCRRRLLLDEDADEDESATLFPPSGIAETWQNHKKHARTSEII